MSRVARVEVQTMWYCAMAQSSSSLRRSSGCSKHFHGCAAEALGHPGQVVGVRDAVQQAGVRARQEDQFHAVTDFAEGSHRIDDGTGDVGEGLPVHGIGGIEEDESSNPSGHPVSGARDHHAAVAVADQDHVAQVLELEHGRNVLNVAVQVHVGVQQVSPLAEAGHRRRVDHVALGLQKASDPLVAPTPVTATVHEHVGRHVRLLTFRRKGLCVALKLTPPS